MLYKNSILAIIHNSFGLKKDASAFSLLINLWFLVEGQ